MKCSLKFFIFVVLLQCLIPNTLSDLPVHCLAPKMEGDWMFHMGDNYSDKDLRCGHKKPDQNLDHYDTDVEKVLKQKYEVVVMLELPDKVLSIIDRKTQVGKWTMVYDEGIELTIHDQVFFAFSRYQKVGKFSASNTDTEDTPGYKNMCDKTFLGWFHNRKTNENWGCYWAEKISKSRLESLDISSVDYKNIFNLNQIPKKSINNLNVLKNNFIKKNNILPSVADVNQNHPGVSGDLFSLLNDLDINKKEPELNNNSSSNINSNSNSLVPNMLLLPTKQILQPHAKNGPIPINTPQNQNTKSVPGSGINYKSDSSNSYIDFVKSLGWENSSGTNFNNIPHLDIYFMNKLSDTDKEQHSGNFLEMEEKTKYFSPDYQYINKINDPKNGYLWKAKVYDDFVGKSYDQMRNLLGNTNFPKHLIGTANTNEDSYSQSTTTNSLLELEIKISHQAESRSKSLLKNHFQKLPEVFDWRNVDGANYDSPIRKQGECGSCYAIAAVSVLEARIRIKSNNRLKPLLSPASIISCSRYNQGCAGGYPYLVGKHGKEFGFVEEGCQPYSESDDKCYNYCFHQKSWKVKDYGYVGGYYGGCDEESMMREVYENGPIVVAINATPELYYYSNGIFHSEARKTEGKYEKGVKPWEYTNHAVVAIGWGEEVVNDNVVKYWILKNSWGAQWGEKGYFRMGKGTNMGSVEAQGVFMSPDLD